MYPHKTIEKKWQEYWEKNNTFKVVQHPTKKKCYVLDMFPYPSSDGLHVGHPEGYTATDIYSRYMRMNGANVLHPMGWDAFGLPAENYAIKKGTHPSETTQKNIETFRRQIKSLGFSYDWSREINTSSPEYYKWTQWLFLELYKKGLASKKKAPVNWGDHCKTVLANEQVVNGVCERCKYTVVQKELEQWFFKVTQYAEQLLADLESLDWPESIKISQRNWIGKSEGAEIEFNIKDQELKIKVFTTRPDTLFGATYLVLAPEHALVEQLKDRIKNWNEVEEYRADVRKKNELERTTLDDNKTGVLLKGIGAINPATSEVIPIWIADYVIASYGTGAIMAVPGHDERDYTFAKKFDLPIRKVILPPSLATIQRNAKDLAAGALGDLHVEAICWTGNGVLVDSGAFSGMSSEEAKKKITESVDGKRTTTYRLRDWLISRQRYWGAPIPIIYCETCGEQGVPEIDLPVTLPTDVDFRPTGESPLNRSTSFHAVTCPNCGGKARRESDTMDTFVCSSWYFLRYASPQNPDVPFENQAMEHWMPVDLYVGGAEHAVLHLLYARFITKALRDMGYLSFGEPFIRLRNQGMILGEDGEKMSKSRGNVINPDEILEVYGADTIRLYEMFMGPFENQKPWNTKGIIGLRRFLERVLSIYSHHEETSHREDEDEFFKRLLHKTIKKVTEDITTFNFNTGISALMVLTNEMQTYIHEKKGLSRETKKTFLKLLSPFAPHIAEELWEDMGHTETISYEEWPRYDEDSIQEKTSTIIIQINGKLRDQMSVPIGSDTHALQDMALSRDAIQTWTRGKTIKNIIVVKGKVVNIVLV